MGALRKPCQMHKKGTGGPGLAGFLNFWVPRSSVLEGRGFYRCYSDHDARNQTKLGLGTLCFPGPAQIAKQRPHGSKRPVQSAPPDVVETFRKTFFDVRGKKSLHRFWYCRAAVSPGFGPHERKLYLPSALTPRFFQGLLHTPQDQIFRGPAFTRGARLKPAINGVRNVHSYFHAFILRRRGGSARKSFPVSVFHAARESACGF